MKKFIENLKVNEKIDTFFMLTKKDLKLTKGDKHYLNMTFSDKTGRIEGRLWDDAEKFNSAVETGDVIQVKGMVVEYLKEKQIKVDHISKADASLFTYEDMVRVAADRDATLSGTRGSLEKIQNTWIKKLAAEFLNDKELMDKLAVGLGAKNWHNAYVGGLLEHTYEVIQIADRMCDICKEANRDIVLIGSFLHDIGKIDELDPKKMEYTVEGGLLGHISIGHGILMKKIDAIPDFPAELRVRLEHIILSHHGEYEQQSPVLPKTLEALIVYHADELVSQVSAVKEIQVLQGASGKVWSDFVNIKNRKFFVKPYEEEAWFQD